MRLFSERYGYTKPSEVFIREQITLEIQNAICTGYDKLINPLRHIDDKQYIHHNDFYQEMELCVWTEFLHKRDRRFPQIPNYNHDIITSFIEDKNVKWYEKLNLVEFTLQYINFIDNTNSSKRNFLGMFIQYLNMEFKILNFAYRIIDNKVVEITAEEEIKAIENAIQDSTDNIKMHLSKALELYAKRPNADYRNSIKESISAVEVYCREKTKTKTLGDALNSLGSNGVVIPEILKVAFVKLYAYTNQPETGIRHSLMDDEGKYTPQGEEAAFMLVACSAFINYLRKKCMD